MSLWRADHSSREVHLTVVHRCVWRRNFKNVDTMGRFGQQRCGEKIKRTEWNRIISSFVIIMWTDCGRIMEWKLWVVRKCLTGMKEISVQILAAIVCRKDSIWNIYAQSAQYSAIYRMKMCHGYVDWTYLAYNIGHRRGKYFSLQNRPLIFFTGSVC